MDGREHGTPATRRPLRDAAEHNRQAEFGEVWDVPQAT